MNEVTIVVKSDDRTDFAPIAAKARAAMGKSAKQATDDVDKIVTARFKEIGEHSGKDFGDSVDTAVMKSSQQLGEHLKTTLKAKVETEFKDTADRSGNVFTRGLRDAASKGGDLFGRTFKGALKKLPGLGEDAGKEAGRSLTGGIQSIMNTEVAGFSPFKIALVAALIGSMPAVGALAASGLVLGFGAGLAGLGLAASHGFQSVQDAQRSFGSQVKTSMKDIGGSFVGVWHTMFDTAGNVLATFQPVLKQALSSIAPTVNATIGHLGDAFKQLIPSIAPISNAFNRLMASVGPQLPAVFAGISNAITDVANTVAANSDMFGNLITGMLELTGYAIGLIATLAKVFSGMTDVAKGDFGGAFNSFKDAITGTSSALYTIPVSADGAAGAMGGLAGSTGDLIDTQKLAAGTAEQLKAALDALTGKSQSAFEATTRYKQALRAATDAAKANNAGIEGNSKAAIQNRSALQQLSTAIKAKIVAMKDDHATASQLTAATDQMRDRFIAAARGMNLSKKAATDLANELLGVKDSSNIKLNVDAQDFFSALHRAQGTKLDPKTGLLKGNNSDYLNKWLKANGLRINPKTGLLRGNNADYYNKWLKANGLRISTKTGKITGNTSPFWSAVHSIPQTVGYRKIGVYYVPLNSANEPGKTRKASGGIIGAAAGGGPRSNMTLVGEQGPELVDLPAGSRVRSNPDSRRLAAGGGGGGGGGSGELQVKVEFVGNAPGSFMAWIKDNIRVTVGSGPNSVQRALGG